MNIEIRIDRMGFKNINIDNELIELLVEKNPEALEAYLERIKSDLKIGILKRMRDPAMKKTPGRPKKLLEEKDNGNRQETVIH